jgi:DNA ligase 1
MPDLKDGETAEVKGSAAKPYVLRNSGGVYSCSCPAWRNQSVPIEVRTCKHLRGLRGDAAETARVGQMATKPSRPAAGRTRTGAPSADAPPLLLAQPWDNLADLTGWWMSEKLDGARAYWDGTRFISRLGNAYRAPEWFCDGLPEVPLDGELWIGRRMFQRTMSIVRRQDASDHWRQVRFVAFDAPHRPEPFEARQALLREWLAGKTEFASVLDQDVCEDVGHLRSELERVVGLGGEGLMLREPGSLYEVGRSTTLLKVKTFMDAEARVVDHLPGKGKHKGRLGALVVEMLDGTRFSIGTGFTDAERVSPPPLGSLITYRYQELTDGGVPRFPTFLRVRSDL